jgi:hypothetical protein
VTFPVKSMFSSSVQGTCIYCGEVSKVIASVATMVVGVCDLCSYALRHAWKRELGEIVASSSPKVVSTYVLFARLPEGRNELDVSSYELLVRQAPAYGEDRFVLPSCEFLPPTKIAKQMGSVLGVVTWDATMREIYLGYSGAGEFSNVLLAWSWGAVPGQKPRGTWTTFGELLSKPTPEAGFNLGVKAAFETLLWRREAQAAQEPTEDLFPVSVVLGEGAVRCLGENEDPKMLEIFRASLSSGEAEVVRLVEAARREAEAAKLEATGKYGKSGEPTESGEATPNFEVDDGDAEEPNRNPASIPPGYARRPR